jgi:large subunit ribosomal protein L24
MKQTIRKGDNVRVMRGDKADVGKVGEVIRMLLKEERVVVQGVNMVKKHQKQQQSGGKTIPSGIMEFEAPVHISNVELVTEASEKETKANATKRTPATKAPVAKKATAKAEKKETVKPAAKKPAATKPAAAKKPAAEKAPAAKKPASKKASE